jgi:hypothetical protein
LLFQIRNRYFLISTYFFLVFPNIFLNASYSFLIAIKPGSSNDGDMNVSWYVNSDPECSLNPLLKFVNSNGDEENKAIISWANENGIELIDLKNCTEAE